MVSILDIFCSIFIAFMSNYKRFEKNTINMNLRPHISRRWLVISHFCKSVLSGFGQKSRRGLIDSVELNNSLKYFLKQHCYFYRSVSSRDFLVHTLTCQIIVQDHLIVQVPDFSEINKRVGPNKAVQVGFFLIYVGENQE